MADAKSNQKERLLKFTAAVISAMLVISSPAMIGTSNLATPLTTSATGKGDMLYQSRPFDVKSILTADGSTWVSFDATPPGTPAEAHVTVSDTAGITVVADFHGFWRGNFTINGTKYDDLNMPGAGSIDEAGKPMLPCLFEFLEIPHDIDASIKVVSASTASRSGYKIRPAPPPEVPGLVYESLLNATMFTDEPPIFDPVYTDNSFYPGNTTTLEGEQNATSWIMRGHRLLGLTFYPVQYNPVAGNLTVYSQLVVRLEYSVPAQIQPVAEHLRSIQFERILSNTILNNDWSSVHYMPMTGTPTGGSQPPPGYDEGAEYLIITNDAFKLPAHRLAEWKERKGTPSAVVTVDTGEEEIVRAAVKDEIVKAYTGWYPAPTYVLLLGDVEFIPATYEVQQKVGFHMGIPFISEWGFVASDLGYFNIEGEGFFPDMIYGRISVDTEEQAQTVVHKILQYEQSPPYEESFYDSALFAGYFQDTSPREGLEDSGFPFIWALERIRHYLKDEYSVHINYSCAWPRQEPLYFREPIEGSDVVSESLPEGYEWLWGFDNLVHRENAIRNITLSINDGRFLVLYYGHGGSENRIDLLGKRDYVEGWDKPFFNTTCFSDLANGHMTPIVISMACSTGWFDGEADEKYLYYGDTPGGLIGHNRFEDYATECFAEDITRLEGGGAVAAIATSRPAYPTHTRHLMDGLAQAFWPGYLESDNQPIYEMGAALLFAKLYMKGQFGPDPVFMKPRTTFEEYHLFGDPETQLWTETPTWVNVTYPHSVGTTDPQRFAVTVVESFGGKPVNFAKVCVQQDSENDNFDIYEVGYTDSNGQVIFEIDPRRYPLRLNLTVTKHNIRPWVAHIDVVQSDASIYVSPNPVMEEDILTIVFNQFLAEASKTVIIQGYRIADLPPGVTEYHWQVEPGPTRFLNMRVWSSTGLTVDCFQRLSTDDGPDPYIYSQDDPSTWEDPTGEAVWDNPDIRIYLDGTEVSSLTQGRSNRIEVAVHNRGDDMDSDALVTLSWAPFGGGVSWTWIGDWELDVDRGMTGIAPFTFSPGLGQTVCLRVDISHVDERVEDRINNIGYENVDVIEMSSPGVGSFEVGNPTDTTSYVTITVMQLGDHEDVWNASILGYSSQAMGAGEDVTVSLFIDSLLPTTPELGRLFRVEIFTGRRLIGGMTFNTSESATMMSIPPEVVILFLGVVVVGVLVLVWRRR